MAFDPFGEDDPFEHSLSPYYTSPARMNPVAYATSDVIGLGSLDDFNEAKFVAGCFPDPQ